MKRIDPRILNALVLGVLGLALNLGINSLGGPPSLSIGSLFLFLSAGAIGVPGAVIASTVALTPTIFWQGMSFECARLFLFSLAIGYASQRLPRLPQFVVVAAGWVAAFGLIAGGWTSGAASAAAVMAPLLEMALSLVAGALLLNPTIWATLAQRPRVPSAPHLLVHVITLVALTAMWSGIAAFEPTVFAAGTVNEHLWWTGKMFLFGVAFPAIVAMRLGDILVRDFQEWFRLGASPANRTFSGLSSDYWRRNESDDFIPVSSSTSLSQAAPATPSGEGEAAQTPGISPDRGICSLNRDGTITFINRRFAKLGGMRSTEVIGKKIDSVGLQSELVVHIGKLVEESLDRGPRVTEFKINNAGTFRFFEVAAMPADQLEESAMSAGPDCAIITLKDITDRRTVEAHLLQAQRLGSLGDLVGGIAHAFNNSLTTIIGRASFARASGEHTAAIEALDEIVSAAAHAGALVRQLRALSEEGPNLMADHDLNKVVGARVELLHNIVGENYTLTFSPAPEGIAVECDPNLLAQAITNIVLNARDAYNGKTGTIELSLATETLDADVSDLFVGARPGDFARIRVKDTGFGMSPETLARAFDPLFSTKRSKGNSGLGLSIVYSIIRAHDGFLAAESHPEKGTTITLYLPLRAIVATDAAPVSASAGSNELPSIEGLRSAGRETILVVEDEKQVRELVATMLEKLGYDVVSCANGAEALERFHEREFDLILLDMIMPRMNGSEVIASIKESGRTTQWLMMTGYGYSPEGVDADTPVIPKPFDIVSLGRAVKEVLHA
ncbi:MAG: hypothetical protein RL417_755 [Pseudomonadota bacterium]|jgi:PAS domain S-box-containing protein